MAYVGTTHTDTFPNWQDIDNVRIDLSRDGTIEPLVANYAVPSVQVGNQQVYSMSYTYTLAGDAAAVAFLIYTPLAPNDDIPAVNGNQFTIEELPDFIPRPTNSLNIGVLV